MGQVTEISAIIDPQTFDVRIRVKIELVRGVIKVSAEGQRFKDQHEAVEGLIQRVPARPCACRVCDRLALCGARFPPRHPSAAGPGSALTELPTIPSDMDQLKSTLQQAMADFRNSPSRPSSTNSWR